MYATGVTRIQSVVLRRIGGRGHFRSRNADGGIGGHTIRSAVGENPMLYASLTTNLLYNWSYCRLKFYIAGIGNFAFFAKNSGNYFKISFAPQKGRRCRWSTFSDPLPTVLSCMLPELLAFQFNSVVLRRIGERGQFWSHDKDGGHTRSAMAENPMLCANFTTLSFIEPELVSIEVLHCGNRKFRVFLRKIVEIIKKNFLHPKKYVDVAESHFLTHYRLCYIVCYRSYTHSKCCFTPNRWAWSLPVTWQRWRSQHSIRNGRNPLLYANFTVLSSIACVRSYFLLKFFYHCENREFRVFLRKIVEIIKKIYSHPKKDVAVTETHFLTHYRLF